MFYLEKGSSNGQQIWLVDRLSKSFDLSLRMESGGNAAQAALFLIITYLNF